MALPADSTRCKQMQPDYLLQVLPLLTYFYIILLSVAYCFLNGSFSCPHKLSVKNTIVGGVCHRGTAFLILKLSQCTTFLFIIHSHGISWLQIKEKSTRFGGHQKLLQMNFLSQRNNYTIDNLFHRYPD